MAIALATTTMGGAIPGSADSPDKPAAKHVLLLSIDGMHQSDLSWYVGLHPHSTLANLVGNGVEFTGAQTPFPSDSFPGMVAQVTGGNPSSTGVYYDDSFNKALLPAGTSLAACFAAKGKTPGVEVTYFEALDTDPLALGAGQPGITATLNPGGTVTSNILNLTGNPNEVINSAALPVDPASCAPVYPHSYLRVNTMFEVARNAGLPTAWTDKHPAYEILNGPSGTGVQDLFTPEINSNYPGKAAGDDWTKDNVRTQQYDAFKVASVINEIHGKDHSGTKAAPVPAIFGMNFQSVSTGQKLLKSTTAASNNPNQAGGYVKAPDGQLVPGPVLAGALDFVNTEIGTMVAEIDAAGLAGSTAIILSAKHGQSPIDPAQLERIKDGPIVDAMNAAWKAAGHSADLVTFSVNDDGMLLWFNPPTDGATADGQAVFAKSYLLSHSAPGTDIHNTVTSIPQSGLREVLAGQEAADFLGVQRGDPRLPDVIGIARVGTVYTGGSKIAEHGGDNPADRNVPLVVSGAPVGHHGSVGGAVETTQIAPTILKLLGLDPNNLQAVHIEHTKVLPLRGDD